MTALDAAIRRAYGLELATERHIPPADADAEAFLRAAIEIGRAIGDRRSAEPPAAPPWEALPQRPVTQATAAVRRAAVARALAAAGASGARWDGIEVRVDAAGSAAVVATRALVAGETILAVPRRSMIVVADRDELAVWLALETRDPNSPARAYLDALPARFDELPVFRADVRALEGTGAHALATEDNLDVRASHARLPSEIRARVSLADFAWGCAVVKSRGFHAPGTVEHEIALVPVVDFFDHRLGDTTWTFEPAAGELALVTDRAFAAGEGVGFPYGDRSNTRLLVQYGFTEASGNTGEGSLVFERAADPTVDLAGHLLWGLPLAAPSRAVVGAVLDQRMFRALSIARLHATPAAELPQVLEHGLTSAGDLPWLGVEREETTLAILAAAARRGLADLAANAPRGAPDSVWDRSCALVRDSERAVLEQVSALARDGAAYLRSRDGAPPTVPLQLQFRRAIDAAAGTDRT